MFKIPRFKSDFATNVKTLLTGTTLAQGVTIGMTPILTRIYTPAEFGVLALFLAISNILSSIACGRYELAIMLPESDEDAFNVAGACVFIAGCMSTALFVLVLFLGDKFAEILGNQSLEIWLYFVPLYVFLLAVFNMLNYLNTRSKYYKEIATAKVLQAIIVAAINVGLNFVTPGSSGLVLGSVAGQFSANISLLRSGLEKFDVSMFRTQIMKLVMLRYIDFPKFSMWAVLANSLSSNLLNLLVSSFYSVATLGHFSIAQKLLGIPSNLLGNAISQVYFQEIVAARKVTGKAELKFRSTFKLLVVISAFIFVPLYFLLPELFTFVLGEKWKTAGEIAKLLLPFYFVRFVSVSVSTTLSAYEKNKISLLINVGLAIVSVSTFFCAIYLGADFYAFAIYYSGIMAIMYSLFVFWYLKIVQAG